MQGGWGCAWPAVVKRVQQKALGTVPSSALLLVLTLGAGSLRVTAPEASFCLRNVIFLHSLQIHIVKRCP